MPLIPVLLPGAPDPATLPVFLSELTWSDLREGLTEDVLNELARRIPRRPAEVTPRLAGAGPRLHNLPFLSIGDLLKGRDDDLQMLATSLQGPSHATAITQRQVIHGLGGIGKTRLAVEYAWRSGDRYNAVFFVIADSPDTLRSSLAALAGPTLLNLPERQAAAEAEIAGAVLRWLRENAGWLLILDNVDTAEAEQAVLEILPQLQSGHVLITSRRTNWPIRIEEKALEKLPREEATRFLLNRTERRRTKKEDDFQQADRIALILDGLPLALEQAGAYIVHRRISFSAYLEGWKKERKSVLTWFDPTVMEYPAPITVTWQKTFEQLGSTARAILRLAAFLAPEPIPVAMFEKGRKIVEQAMSLLSDEPVEEVVPQSIQDSLGDLAAYSMAVCDEESFTIHRMMQEVVATRIPPEKRKDWVNLSLQLVDDFSPPDPGDVRTWVVWNPLRPHAARVIELADREGIPEPTGRLMNQLGQLLDAKSLYSEAKPLMERALALAEQTFGKEHPNVAIRLNNLAQLLQATNRLSEAEPLMRRAVEIFEQSLGADHPNTQIVRRNLEILLKESAAERERSEARPGGSVSEVEG